MSKRKYDVSNRPSQALENRAEIISQVERGIPLEDIISNLKMDITPQGICNKLASDPEYKSARVAGLEARLQTCINNLEKAETRDDVLKWDKLSKLACWKLEHLVSEVYGSQPKINIAINTVPTSDVLEKDASELIKSIK
jgi:hypothetical protein